jgi:hypothetical protein
MPATGCLTRTANCSLYTLWHGPAAGLHYVRQHAPHTSDCLMKRHPPRLPPRSQTYMHAFSSSSDGIESRMSNGMHLNTPCLTNGSNHTFTHTRSLIHWAGYRAACCAEASSPSWWSQLPAALPPRAPEKGTPAKFQVVFATNAMAQEEVVCSPTDAMQLYNNILASCIATLEGSET